QDRNQRPILRHEPGPPVRNLQPGCSDWGFYCENHVRNKRHVCGFHQRPYLWGSANRIPPENGAKNEFRNGTECADPLARRGSRQPRIKKGRTSAERPTSTNTERSQYTYHLCMTIW